MTIGTPWTILPVYSMKHFEDQAVEMDELNRSDDEKISPSLTE